MDLQLEGRKVLVTGATRGIGRAIAETFVDEGAAVGICARNAAGVDETLQALAARGGKVAGAAVDVSDSAALKTWVDDMAEALGGVDILVSNVSALGAGMDLEAWKRSFEVDVLGTVAGVDAVLPHIEKSDAASIVMINTTGSVQVFGPPTAYPAVKAAILSYMKYLSAYLAPRKIRVNAVSPGAVYFEGGVWDRRRRNEPERYERMIQLTPIGRLGKPEEIASAVAFLASPRSAYTSGTNLVIDGASTTRVQN